MSLLNLIPWKNQKKQIATNYNSPDSTLDIQRNMNRIFDNFFNTSLELSPMFNLWDGQPEGFTPQLDVIRTEKEYRIEVEMPGIKEEDIEITLEQDRINIQGEKKAEKVEKGASFYRSERVFGAFQRSFPLPQDVDPEKIKAAFKNGILTLTLPRHKELKDSGKHIPILKG